MIVSTTKMKAKQFLQLGEDPPGVRLELVNGEVAVSPSPIPDHSHVDTMLRIIVGQHVVEHDLGQLFGDVDTILGDFDVRRPDILFFSKARLHLIGDKAMEGPPDLCVEILSPSSITVDREDKLDQYCAAGVANYWIVDPATRTIQAFRVEASAYVESGSGKDSDTVYLEPFPRLAIPLGKLWRPKSR
jgi:Uma2 family endonuclease